MQATQLESDAYYAKAEGEICTRPPLHPKHLLTPILTVPVPNFISEIFFLCSTYLHLGPMCAIKAHKDMTRHLSQLKNHIDDVEADNSWRGVRLIHSAVVGPA